MCCAITLFITGEIDITTIITTNVVIVVIGIVVVVGVGADTACS